MKKPKKSEPVDAHEAPTNPNLADTAGNDLVNEFDEGEDTAVTASRSDSFTSNVRPTAEKRRCARAASSGKAASEGARMRPIMGRIAFHNYFALNTLL